MKKIIIPFDGGNFSKGAFEFANKLNQSEPILLAGLFLPQVDYANLWSYSGGGMAGPVFVPLVEDADVEVITHNIVLFRSLCEKNGIEYRVHENYFEFALPELKKETRFADLMVIGSEDFYKNMGTKGPNAYLRDAMHGSECPVVIVPDNFSFPESVVLAYDGSESSVFAIKQFAYVFPHLTSLPTLLVTADVKRPTKDFPEQSNIEELAARHFSQLTFMKLEFDPRKYFGSWMIERKSSILVCGAFERSAFSEAIRKSFVNEVISAHQLPVFLAHR
ncbi:MAG TPA: hypothetical protein VEV87_02480 [Chitinophagaceae bacterium]|nr:hypothetical protein [Chitinophagaceae bacterium]